MTRRTAVVAAAVAALLTLTGCSRELVDTPGQSVGVATSPEAVRGKLDALVQDPCFAAVDPSRTWPVCGRWVEEAASTARTATGASPGNAALGRAGTAVGAGRDAFVARGCVAAGSPAVAPDPAACVGALLSTRDGVRALGAALPPPS